MKQRMLALSVAISLTVACGVAGEGVPNTANALCPMGREPVLESGGSTTWKGIEVGFCCARCLPMFEALSDEEKAQALAEVGVENAG